MRFTCRGVLIGCLVAAAGAPACLADIRIIARTGDAAPGLAGLTLSDVGSPRLNASGRIAFTATLSGPGVNFASDSSIWLTDLSGATPTLLLREQEPGPFTDAGVLGGVSLPLLNQAGDVALPATNVVGDGPVTGGFMVVEANGVRRAVALEGVPAVGITPPRNFAGFGLQAFNDAGATAFAANRNAGQPSAIGSAFAGGVWTDRTGSTLTLIAVHGQDAPGFDGGVTYSSLESPSINGSGALLFRSTVAGTGLTDDTNTGLWSDRGGTLALVARAGGAVPGFPAGATFADFSLQPVLLDSGRAVYWGRAGGGGVDATNDAAIFTDLNGVASVVVREGDLVSGIEPARFGTLSRNPSVADDGSLAILTSLVGTDVTSANNGAVVLIPFGGTPLVIAREGARPPRADPAVVFASFGEPVLTIDGFVVFTATVREPAPTSFARSGVYVWSANAGLLPVLLEGQVVDGHATRSITFENLPLPGAASSGGKFLLRAGFADGSAVLIAAGPPCLADFNSDGLLFPDDLSEFITCFFLQLMFPGFCGPADFNGDGLVMPDDLSEYITAFFMGCP